MLEWQLVIIFIVGGLIVMMALGLPVAFCFLILNIIGEYLFFNGMVGLTQLIHAIFDSLSSFILLALPLFILMGEVMFHSGIAPNMIDTLDKWLGRVPGRLGLLAVGGGTIFATLSGSSLGSVGMLGSTLALEMEKRGYKKPMSLGPILGSGGLAVMIPPSVLAILIGALGRISIGKILIAIIIPGLVMAILYASYIVGRCWLQPSIAPSYAITLPSISARLIATLKYILPLGLVIFAVIGVIFVGIATPSEAAALGCLACFFLALLYRKLNWDTVRKSFKGTLRTTGMIFMIISGAVAFSQILAFSGASRGLVEFVLSFPMPPILVVIVMQVILLVAGSFLEVVAMMMVCLPLYLPIIKALGFDQVWFAVILLLNMEMGLTSPPFGLGLFVMKGVSPPDTTMGDIYRAALPFLLCDLIVMTLIIIFPKMVLWLPGLMR